MADLITSLQTQLSTAHGMLAQFVGNLTQVAGPAPISNEPLMTPPPGAATKGANGQPITARAAAKAVAANSTLVAENSEAYAEQLMRTFKDMAASIDRIPALRGGEAEQLARLSALQKENDALRAELQSELAAAETKLELVHEVYGVLAQSQFDANSRAAAAEAGKKL